MGGCQVSRGVRVVAIAAAAMLVVPAAPAVAGGARTVRVSVADNERQGDNSSMDAQISADGRYVAFFSSAGNLVPGDTSVGFDLFVRDLRLGTTRRVNVSSTGAQADEGAHSQTRISADGRYVAFLSYATNLVPGDTNGASDAFVRDLRTGRTTRVSVGGGGAQGNGSTAFGLALSADGRYVLFDSYASNLVPGDTNGLADVFLHDRRTGRTSRVSVAEDGTEANHFSEAPGISADGRWVVFDSFAGNLAPGDTNDFSDVFLLDRRTGKLRLISRTPAGGPGRFGGAYPSISADGRMIAYNSESPDLVPGDTNGVVDAFTYDRRTGRTERVSVSTAGRQADDHINLTSISAGGHHVVFSSPATTLVPGDTNADDDVFVRDLRRRTTTLVSVGAAGRQGNGWSSEPSAGADGRVIAFTSAASNLVRGDTNATYDVFVRRR